jgi:hypothetical protein
MTANQHIALDQLAKKTRYPGQTLSETSYEEVSGNRCEQLSPFVAQRERCKTVLVSRCTVNCRYREGREKRPTSRKQNAVQGQLHTRVEITDAVIALDLVLHMDHDLAALAHVAQAVVEGARVVYRQVAREELWYHESTTFGHVVKCHRAGEEAKYTSINQDSTKGAVVEESMESHDARACIRMLDRHGHTFNANQAKNPARSRASSTHLAATGIHEAHRKAVLKLVAVRDQVAQCRFNRAPLHVVQLLAREAEPSVTAVQLARQRQHCGDQGRGLRKTQII